MASIALVGKAIPKPFFISKASASPLSYDTPPDRFLVFSGHCQQSIHFNAILPAAYKNIHATFEFTGMLERIGNSSGATNC